MTYVTDHGEAPSDLMVCEACGRAVAAGLARKHENRFHGGAPVVVTQADRWLHVEKRMADRRQRIAQTMEMVLAWERRHGDRRHGPA